MNEVAGSLKDIISGKVTHNRKRLMGYGILSLLLGVAGMFMNVTATLTSIFVLGVFLTIIGLILMVETFSAPDWKGKLFNLLIAVLYVIAGVVTVANPTASAVWFTFFMAGFFILTGTMRIIMGFQAKNEINSWGWIAFSGFLNIVLGIMIYAEWPESGLWVIGLFVSIELIIQGVSSILLSREIKRVQEEVS